MSAHRTQRSTNPHKSVSRNTRNVRRSLRMIARAAASSCPEAPQVRLKVQRDGAAVHKLFVPLDEPLSPLDAERHIQVLLSLAWLAHPFTSKVRSDQDIAQLWLEAALQAANLSADSNSGDATRLAVIAMWIAHHLSHLRCHLRACRVVSRRICIEVRGERGAARHALHLINLHLVGRDASGCTNPSQSIRSSTVGRPPHARTAWTEAYLSCCVGPIRSLDSELEAFRAIERRTAERVNGVSPGVLVDGRALLFKLARGRPPALSTEHDATLAAACSRDLDTHGGAFPSVWSLAMPTGVAILLSLGATSVPKPGSALVPRGTPSHTSSQPVTPAVGATPLRVSVHDGIAWRPASSRAPIKLGYHAAVQVPGSAGVLHIVNPSGEAHQVRLHEPHATWQIWPANAEPLRLDASGAWTFSWCPDALPSCHTVSVEAVP